MSYCPKIMIVLQSDWNADSVSFTTNKDLKTVFEKSSYKRQKHELKIVKMLESMSYNLYAEINCE